MIPALVFCARDFLPSTIVATHTVKHIASRRETSLAHVLRLQTEAYHSVSVWALSSVLAVAAQSADTVLASGVL